MTKYVNATNARKQFFTLLNLASKPGHTVTISLEGIPKVVMMSQEEFEGWMETLDIMSDPELVKDIQEGIADMEAGRCVPWEKVKKEVFRKTK